MDWNFLNFEDIRANNYVAFWRSFISKICFKFIHAYIFGIEGKPKKNQFCMFPNTFVAIHNEVDKMHDATLPLKAERRYLTYCFFNMAFQIIRYSVRLCLQGVTVRCVQFARGVCHLFQWSFHPITHRCLFHLQRIHAGLQICWRECKTNDPVYTRRYSIVFQASCEQLMTE